MNRQEYASSLALTEGLADLRPRRRCPPVDIAAMRRHCGGASDKEAAALYRWARRTARRIGLSYWPALLVDHEVDWQAFLVAEEILAQKSGGRYGDQEQVWVEGEVVVDFSLYPTRGAALRAAQSLAPHGTRTFHHGGWDSTNHHGPSAGMVAAMWWAAGCRNSAKFRWQVRNNVLLRRRTRLSQAFQELRAQRFLDNASQWRNQRPWLGQRLYRALGRVSRLTAHAICVVAEVHWDVHWTAATLSNLDWPLVRRLVEQARKSPRAEYALTREKRVALWSINSIATKIQGATLEAVIQWLTPQYPRISHDQACDLVLGKTPAQVAGPELSGKEAHAWLVAGAPTMSRWLARHVGLPADVADRVRSTRIARWLGRVWANPPQREALYRNRTAHGPAGQARTFKFIDVLDELQDVDLEGNPGVSVAFERAAQRVTDAQLAEAARQHAPLAPVPSWARELSPSFRLLNTPAELVTEGKILDHCVGGYGHAVSNGQAVILSVRSRLDHTTVELDRDATVVRQHRGRKNQPAHPRHEALVRGLINRVRRARDGQTRRKK